MNLYPFIGIAAIVFGKSFRGSKSESSSYSKRSQITPTRLGRTPDVISKMKKLDVVEYGDFKIINLTPHPIRLKKKYSDQIDTIIKSGGYLRLSTRPSTQEAYGFDDIVVEYANNSVVNIHFRNGREFFYGSFPSEEELAKDSYFDDIWFLVSRVSMTRLSSYSKILTVGDYSNKGVQSKLVVAENLCDD